MLAVPDIVLHISASYVSPFFDACLAKLFEVLVFYLIGQLLDNVVDDALKIMRWVAMNYLIVL